MGRDQSFIVRDELAELIAANHSEDGAREMADLLLSQHNDYRFLVGIDERGERAIFYDKRAWDVLRVPFDSDGYDSQNVEQIEHVGGFHSFTEWLGEQDTEKWQWVHPRFRFDELDASDLEPNNGE